MHKSRRTLQLTYAVWLACSMVSCGGDAMSDRQTSGPAQLTLSNTPLVSIGVVDGDERYQFVRVTAAWKQRNGRIVVLDPGRAALLFFDSGGAYLSESGGRGQGPGEMQQIAMAWPYRGDSIAVYDLMMRRVSVYDHDGHYARSFQNPVRYERKPGTMPSQSCCTINGVFEDGSFVGHPPDDIPTTVGPDRYSTFTPWRISADGTESHPIASFASRLFRHDAGARSGVRGYETSYSFRYVAVNDRLIGGNGFGDGLQSVEVAAAAHGKGPVTIDTVPLPRPGQAFSKDLQLAYEQALRADFEARPKHYEGTLDIAKHIYPETTPSFVNIRGDGIGRIWLERWTPRYGRAGGRSQYDLIDTVGTHVGTIDLPSGSSLLWADERHVLLLERDEVDVQYVRMYGLVREEASTDRRQ